MSSAIDAAFFLSPTARAFDFSFLSLPMITSFASCCDFCNIMLGIIMNGLARNPSPIELTICKLDN